MYIHMVGFGTDTHSMCGGIHVHVHIHVATCNANARWHVWAYVCMYIVYASGPCKHTTTQMLIIIILLNEHLRGHTEMTTLGIPCKLSADIAIHFDANRT